jgi:hypothetical protein
MRPYLENNHHKKRAGGETQVQALSLSPSTAKTKKNKKKKKVSYLYSLNYKDLNTTYFAIYSFPTTYCH